jgi:hypothetical protein
LALPDWSGRGREWVLLIIKSGLVAAAGGRLG